jgi:hypothetical protein
MHGATEVEVRMQVAQVWESEECAQRFEDEYLNPTLKALGIPLERKLTLFGWRTSLRPRSPVGDAAVREPAAPSMRRG